MNELDIIGDVHGKRAALETLLTRLGYAPLSGIWRHPQGRKAVFIGDIVDRGEDIPGSLKLVKSMVDAGEAFAVLGNHEYGLLAWYTLNPDGEPRRKHLPRYRDFMNASVQFFDAYPEERDLYLAWFRTLPLTLDLGGARFVHAYWDTRRIAEIGVGTHLDQLGWSEPTFPATTKQKVKSLICGPEMKLPDGTFIVDRQNRKRTETRVKWWEINRAHDLRGVIHPDCEALSGHPIPDQVRDLDRPRPGDPPLFFGHYGFHECPGLLGPSFTCVDFQGPGKHGIGAYRWQGEETLREENLVR